MAEEVKKENLITEEQSNLAKKLLQIIVNSDIRLGDRVVEEEPEKYKKTVLEMLDLLYKNNVLEIELDLYFQLMRQAVGIAQNSTMGSVKMSKDIALTNYWGKHPDNVTFQDIDAKMKKDKR